MVQIFILSFAWSISGLPREQDALKELSDDDEKDELPTVEEVYEDQEAQEEMTENKLVLPDLRADVKVSLENPANNARSSLLNPGNLNDTFS